MGLGLVTRGLCFAPSAKDLLAATVLALLAACSPDNGAARATPGDGGLADGASDSVSCPQARVCSARCCDEGEECVDGLRCMASCNGERCGVAGDLCCAGGRVCVASFACGADCAAGEMACGASYDVCCAEHQVCTNDLCVTPGSVCSNDFDCLEDRTYCEAALAQCLPIPVGVSCTVAPEFDRVDLTVEWHWTGLEIDGLWWSNILAAPVVGDVSGDGTPDVVVNVYRAQNWDETVLVAIDGAAGETLWHIPRGPDAPDALGVALANFDPSDAALEVAYSLESGGVRIVDGDGTAEIARRADEDFEKTVEVADLDADGTPDIIHGCSAFNGFGISDPLLDFFANGLSTAAGTCRGEQGVAAPSIGDLDGDGEPEITVGSFALNADGSTLWTSAVAPGLTAIADIAGDSAPEVVVVSGGEVNVLAGADGSVLLGPLPVPGGGIGGAPNVADFDGDGAAEIGTAGTGQYVVFDPDCGLTARAGGRCEGSSIDGVAWTSVTQDVSSSSTGSSVFDFQGDGAAEVIYNDECFLHVYDGRTGADILSAPRPNSSRTYVEYPLVADVDGDGNAEILVGANRDQAIERDHCDEAYAAVLGVAVADVPSEIARGTSGLYLLGDPRDRWVKTRPIWNEYGYHVTNVEPTGEVPAPESDNWRAPGLNNYRQNEQGSRLRNAADLAVELEASGPCGDLGIRLTARVANVGARSAPPRVSVDFYDVTGGGERWLARSFVEDALLPGQRKFVSVLAAEVTSASTVEFEVRVDKTPPDGIAFECDETNNSAQATVECGEVQ